MVSPPRILGGSLSWLIHLTPQGFTLMANPPDLGGSLSSLIHLTPQVVRPHG